MTFLRARSRAGARGAIAALRLPVAAVTPWVLASLVAGCGTTTYDYGTPVVTMHTSNAGFTAYKVGIASMYVTRTDGLTISLLGGAYEEQLDMATLSNTPELVATPAVPTGQYTTLTVSIDTGASVVPVLSVNVNGTDVPVAATSILDTTATTIYGSYQTFVLTFDPAHPFIVQKNQSFRIDFDLDLEASNIIDTSTYTGSATTSPTVYANPVITPNFNPVDAGPLRARGLMVVVQPNMSPANFIMNMHPFIDQYYALGALVVNVTPQTYYNINGTAYVGSLGLTALQEIPISGNVAAYGTLGDVSTAGITPTFNATTVIGGTSLEDDLQSHIQGVVSATTSSSITVKGATYLPNALLIVDVGCYPLYYNSINVTVDNTTIVSQDGVMNPVPTLASIPVGQQIDISGQPINTTGGVITDCTAPDHLDATYAAGFEAYPTAPSYALPGQARLEPTWDQGTLLSATAGSAQLDLLQVGNFASSAFSFTAPTTPSAFNVNTGSTDLSSLPAGTMLNVSGYPAAPSAAPPDFNALSAAPVTNQQLVIEWWKTPSAGGILQPFTNVTSAGVATPGPNLLLDGTDPTLSRHVLLTGASSSDLDTLPAYPTIVTTDGVTQFTVGNSVDGVFLYSDVADFETAVAKLMATVTTPPISFNKLVAQGQYNATTNQFNATSVILMVVQ